MQTDPKNNYFCSFPTAIGTMAIAWNSEGILSTRLPDKNEKALRAALQKIVSGNCTEASPPEIVSSIIRSIQKHLEGTPQNFSLSVLNLNNIPNFYRAVYKKAVCMGNGEVLSYGELAKIAGSPKAARAVGQAMAKNPFPIIVPCHRVFAAGNKSGGFSAHGGVETKYKILSIEQNASR